MSKIEILGELKNRIIDLDDDAVFSLVKQGLEEGITPTEIVNDGLNPGLTDIGEGFARAERFMSDLVIAGEIMTETIEMLRPLMEKSGEATGDVMVIGTVEGDFHVIGKRVVSAMFIGSGFKVIDIGENVSANQFVKAVKEHKADVVGCSAILSAARPYVKVVCDALVDAGIRDDVVVAMGGWGMTQDWVTRVGADCFGDNAVDALHKIKKLLAEKKKTSRGECAEQAV